METVTVYAAATPASPSTADPTAEPIAGDSQQPPASSPAAVAPNATSQPSSSHSSKIALWVPVGVVIFLIVLVLLAWATKSQRKELHWRAEQDPDAPIAFRRDRNAHSRTLASMRDLQQRPNDNDGSSVEP